MKYFGAWILSMAGVVFLCPAAAQASAEAFSIALSEEGQTITLPSPHADGFCGTEILFNHDGTIENAYGWLFDGVVAPDYGAFAECFEGRFRICEVQFHFAQVGHQAGQTMDVYVWDDLGNGSPGAVLAMVPEVELSAVATWPQTSRHDVEVAALVEGKWWVGYWGDWPGAQAGWFIGADEDGPGGCPRTNVAPGLGLPQGWEHPSILSSWASCRSLAIEVQGRNALPVGSVGDAARFAGGGLSLESRSGDCSEATVFKNHDGTVENAYGWIYNGVTPPDFGAFAECFQGDAEICEVQFFFSQIGGYSGQDLDVYVWEDSGVDSPGAVVAMLPGVEAGSVALWPNVSQHTYSISASVSDRWWVGYWGDWPDEEAGWFIAADETGPGGCSRTRVSPDSGFPTGWEHPSVVPSWESCRSLAIQVVATENTTDVLSTPLAAGGWTASPNPFRDSVVFERSDAGEVASKVSFETVSIVDVSGREIRRETLAAGQSHFQWDGTNEEGAPVPSGTYFVSWSGAAQMDARRIVKLP